MLPLLCPGILRACVFAGFLACGLAGFAQEPAVTSAAEDMEANLKKSVQGYKVGDPARYRDLFEPLRTEHAALSPDGQHLAYVVRNGYELHLHVVPTNDPGVLKARARLDDVVQEPLTGREYGTVDWLGWVTAERLVVSTNGWSHKGHEHMFTGRLIAINADGSNPRVLAVPGDFREITRAASRGSHSLQIIGLDPNRADSIVFVALTGVSFNNTRASAALNRSSERLRVARSVNVLTGEMTKLNETFTRRQDLVLADREGRARITVDFLYRPDPNAPLFYQRTEKTDGARPLDEVTGLRGFSFSPERILGEGSVPLGFGPQGNILYYASNLGRDTHGIYGIDLQTGQRLPGALESPAFDLLSPQMGTFGGKGNMVPYEDRTTEQVEGLHWLASRQLVMNRFTRQLAGVRYEGATRTALWLDPTLQAVQAQLAADRPGHNPEILEWNEDLDRFLVREQSPTDAGAFFLLDRKKNTYVQFARRSPEPEVGSIAQLTPFDFKLTDGSRIDGLIALPKNSKVKKIPLVLLCPDFPWQRRGAGYQPEFEALTRMGFAVAIYNGRGAWGTGLKERQKLQGDYVGIQVADVVAVADYLASKFDNVSRRSVALYGEAHGGHVALRALQLQPDRFRCAVTVDAEIQRTALFDAIVQAKPLREKFLEATRPIDTPLVTQPGTIKAPVFTIATFSKDLSYHASTALHRAVKRNVPDSELFVLTDKSTERSVVLARQWARTESFLNYTLYKFSVSLGELEVLPEEVKAKQP